MMALVGIFSSKKKIIAFTIFKSALAKTISA